MSPAERGWSPATLSPDVPPPVGAYSPGVRAGGFIFLSGQVPKDVGTGSMVEGDVRVQTRVTIENAARILAAAGASLDDVVSVTAYLSRMDDWDAFDATYRELFRLPYPARTTVGVELNGFLVEMSFVALAR
jgi:2-iminobutanoate/2-iminopropanoate deaminase